MFLVQSLAPFHPELVPLWGSFQVICLLSIYPAFFAGRLDDIRYFLSIHSALFVGRSQDVVSSSCCPISAQIHAIGLVMRAFWVTHHFPSGKMKSWLKLRWWQGKEHKFVASLLKTTALAKANMDMLSYDIALPEHSTFKVILSR